MPMTKKELARRIALEDEDSKYCPRCEQVRPLYEFTISKRERKMSHCWCKDCEAEDRRLRAHNMTLKECKELLESQGGKCAICSADTPGGRHKVFHIDHDHKIKNKRKAVRGLLCSACNHGLGNFRDNPEALAEAAAYLLRAKNRKQPLLGEKE